MRYLNKVVVVAAQQPAAHEPKALWVVPAILVGILIYVLFFWKPKNRR